MYQVTVTVAYDVSDLETHNDIMQAISTPLPYMADNVFVQSKVHNPNWQGGE